MKIIIAGAGIGGLTTALMLHARGIKAEVYEQASEVRELGVGINTLPVAIGELADLGLLPALDAVAIRTRELIYLNRRGQEVWRELRGTHAGHTAPQFSVHRGRLQKTIYDAVVQRLGPAAVKTGLRLCGFVQDEGGVTVHFTDTQHGVSGLTVRGDALICADGIHSAGRRLFYSDEGSPCWDGVMMWRGATDWPVFADGETMVISGGMGAKFVLYPIGPGSSEDRRLTNWVVNIKMADGAVSPPPKESWSRTGQLAEVLPYAKRFIVPGFDVEGLVRGTERCFEYPMCDRDPVSRWTFGRITLLGDAAHPMYPVGSNGASQAILDARALADALQRASHPMQALYEYEKLRLPKTAEIVRLNRKGGPEKVIDEAEKRAPAGFSDINAVLSYEERKSITQGYPGPSVSRSATSTA